MSLKQKALIASIILTILTLGVFIVYKQVEISNRQKAIEESMVSQKQLTDNIMRSMSQYTTADQIKDYLKENKVDLSSIQKDLDTLKAKIDHVNTTVVNSLGYDWEHVPSDGVTPSDPPKVTPIECDGKTINCIQDPNKYLSTKQLLKLNEKFKGLDVPFGSVTFDGSQKAPWGIDVLAREYKLITVSATDENNRVTNYNQFKVAVDGKDYSIPITSAATQQVFPEAKFRWFSPRLYLGFDGGLDISQLHGEFGPNLNLSIMNYGRYVQTPEFSILQLGLGAGLVNHKAYFVLTPFAYNVGKHLPFMMNTYLGPSMQVSFSGDIAVMAGLRLGL